VRRQHVELASLSSSFPLNWFKDGTRKITYRTSLGFLERKGSRRQGGVRGKLPETGKILSNETRIQATSADRVSGAFNDEYLFLPFLYLLRISLPFINRPDPYSSRDIEIRSSRGCLSSRQRGHRTRIQHNYRAHSARITPMKPEVRIKRSRPRLPSA